VLLFLWALWQSRKFGMRAGLFPWAVTVPAAILSVAQLVRDLTGRRETDGGEESADGAPDLPPAVLRRRTVEIAVWIVGMFLAIWLVGFAGATLVMTFLYLRLGAGERWTISLALSLGALLFVYGLFERGLGVPFPAGSLLVWLGYG
jgi:hypothetical protein